ncbi:MAG: DUF1343 domain-containing protein [Gammaproteobacteria bacterium]|nr:DUF1343 domain-containing protein [Gammaproteobacteria bacterium]
MTRIAMLFSVIVASAACARMPVKTGAQLLYESGFERLEGLRVGLIVNHTARVNDEHLIDLAHADSRVTVAALFVPEHGLRGAEEDGVAISDGVDDLTGAPVYSLYGRTLKPEPAMLDGLDILVFDIQDVGARFYTYISTMGLAMQAAAEAGMPFMVLDRPNPLSGSYVSGFVLEPELTSFVGQFAIPIAHGLTVGELAQMIKGAALLPGLENLELEVAPMSGWTRSMQWPDTSLPWLPTSPNIPDFTTALAYPGLCLFESTSASEGRGTPTPFLHVGATWADGAELALALNEAGLPGVTFEATTFTPMLIEGMETNPKLSGQTLEGVRIRVTDRMVYQPVETGIHLLHAFYHAAPDQDAFLSRPRWLDRLSGTSRLNAMLPSALPDAIIASWSDELEAFRAARAEYLIYN